MSELKLERISHPDAASTSIEIAASGAVSFSNDIAFNTNTFYVDTANGRVGIGTTSPGYKLQVNGTVDIVNVKGGTGNAFVRFTDNDASADFSIGVDDNSGAGAGAFIVYDRNNTAYRLVVNSSGNVGIGTTTVNRGQLQIASAGNTELHLTGSGQTGSGEGMTITSNSTEGNIWYRNNGYFRIATNNTERMRIDSSGNLFVGHTSQYSPIENGGSGVTLNANGQIFGGSTSPILYLNRENSDGDLAVFRKDGTQVGSIGTRDTGALEIGSGDVYLQFNGANDWIKPVDGSGNNKSGVDLGTSGAKFDNLYLSGGVYLGGTGAANYLDDYEEGEHTCTLTPDSGSITLAPTYDKLFYTKIGRVVHIQGTLNISSVSSPSGAVVFSLPFAVNAGAEGAAYSVGSIRFYNFSFNTSYFFNAISLENTSYFNIQESRSGTTSQSYQASNYNGANQYITIGLTYVTN